MTSTPLLLTCLFERCHIPRILEKNVIQKTLTVVFAACLALVFGLSSPATAEGKYAKIRSMDAEFVKALIFALKKQEDERQPVQARVTTADCPSSYDEKVLHGMCYCEPGADGKCGTGETQTTLGGETMCKVLPTTASVIFNGVPKPAQVQGIDGF